MVAIRRNKVLEDSARALVEKHGFAEAERLCAKWRDMNSWGTASYSLHNAVCKQLIIFKTVG